MSERYTLDAGRLVTDTKTGDMFNIAGRHPYYPGGRMYDPVRLDALAKRIVALLNITDGYSAAQIARGVDSVECG